MRVDIARVLSEPWGLFGGGLGGRAAIHTTGAIDHGRVTMHPGDTLEIITAGAGGYQSAPEPR